ncbi:MAG TPA: hypothetical protein VNV66_04150 [Pilimelia sp.]|nr:hypothetical protein [Pilimelia sp.]
MDEVRDAIDPLGHFEGRLRDLRGRRLTAVDYWDIHPFDPGPEAWDYGDWHHADMGIQLGTDLGPVTVTWTDTFFPYGVEVFHEPIRHHLALEECGPQRVGPELDGGSPWAPLLGSVIRGTACHWERFEVPSGRADASIAPVRTVDVPVALRLDFAAGVVWFVAGIPQLPDLRRVFIPGDAIMVVFCREKMRDMGFEDPAFLRALR